MALTQMNNIDFSECDHLLHTTLMQRKKSMTESCSGDRFLVSVTLKTVAPRSSFVYTYEDKGSGIPSVQGSSCVGLQEEEES